jgi:hypothetical protein
MHTEGLFDFLDSSTYSRQQLLQLLDIFYRMLQQRSVTVNTQVLPTYPPVVNPLPNPFMPLTNGTGDTMFDTNKTTCNAKSSLV